MRDLKSNIGAVHLLDAQDVAGVNASSSLLDLQGFSSAAVLVNVGALTGVDADSFLVIKLQESDTTAAAAFSDVGAADLVGAFLKMDANTKDQVTQLVGYTGTKRYIRALLDFTAGTGGITAALVSVNGIVGHAQERPVVAPAAVAAT